MSEECQAQFDSFMAYCQSIEMEGKSCAQCEYAMHHYLTMFKHQKPLTILSHAKPKIEEPCWDELARDWN